MQLVPLISTKVLKKQKCSNYVIVSAFATALHNAVLEIFQRTIYTSRKGFFEKISTTFQHFRKKQLLRISGEN